jgi:shikimate kinase
VAAHIASLAQSGMLRRPIALAGFMGVGKTTLGRMLAELLERPFFDTDAHVEDGSGRRIDDFFLAGQQADFRRLEAAAVAELVTRGAVVIALGGGALLDDGSRALLRERSLLVHLHVPWRDLRSRVPELVATRPLLRGKSLAEIHRLYLVRLSTYRAAALRVTIGQDSAAGALSDVLVALRSLEGAGRPEDARTPSNTASALEAAARGRVSPTLDLDRTV